jgi:hypothetical protein
MDGPGNHIESGLVGVIGRVGCLVIKNTGLWEMLCEYIPWVKVSEGVNHIGKVMHNGVPLAIDVLVLCHD